MAAEVKLPRLGQGMESGTIVKWLKSVGDEVAKGEAIVQIETEKVNLDVEAPASGVLLAILVDEEVETAIFSTIGMNVRSTNSAWSSAWFMIQAIWSGNRRGFSVW